MKEIISICHIRDDVTDLAYVYVVLCRRILKYVDDCLLSCYPWLLLMTLLSLSLSVFLTLCFFLSILTSLTSSLSLIVCLAGSNDNITRGIRGLEIHTEPWGPWLRSPHVKGTGSQLVIQLIHYYLLFEFFSCHYGTFYYNSFCNLFHLNK